MLDTLIILRLALLQVFLGVGIMVLYRQIHRFLRLQYALSSFDLILDYGFIVGIIQVAYESGRPIVLLVFQLQRQVLSIRLLLVSVEVGDHFLIKFDRLRKLAVLLLHGHALMGIEAQETLG